MFFRDYLNKRQSDDKDSEQNGCWETINGYHPFFEPIEEGEDYIWLEDHCILPL